MELKVGDKVKVIAMGSTFAGCEGVVKTVTGEGRQDILAVTLVDDTMDVRGFFSYELELVLDEEQQIAKIASILYNEPGNEDWDLEHSHKAAESLFRAGVRFRG
jgi:hypothetical protein